MMSTSSGSGDGGTGLQPPIPAASRKMMQSMKAVVNCSEAEIYAALRDCNMDPNEAVNRLLSQDPFREVKSKREKKKEGKDTSESRPHGGNNSSNRGGKSGAHSDRGNLASYNSSESAPAHGRSTYKKENGAPPYSSYLPSVPSCAGNYKSRGTAFVSDDTSTENKGPSWGTSNEIMPSTVQPPLASYSSAWVGGTTGQTSMADIVKKARPHNRVANAPNGSHNNAQGHSTTTTMHNESRFPDDHATKDDDWPSMEKPVASVSKSVLESNVDRHVRSGETEALFDNENQDYESEEDQETYNEDVETSAVNDVGCHSFSSRMFLDDDSGGGPIYENDLYNAGSYMPQANDFKRHEGEGGVSVSSVTRNFEQLSVEKDDTWLASEGDDDDDAPCVIIPDHLKVWNSNCSLLSFGNFRSGMTIPYPSGAATPRPVETNFEGRQNEVDVPSAGHGDSEYYADDSYRNGGDGSLYHRSGSTAGRHDVVSSASQQEQQLKPEHAGVHQYSIQSSSPAGYSFDNSSQLLNADIQNHSTFSNVMQQFYPSSLSSTLLASDVQQHSRESEQHQQYFPFPITPAMAAKYGISAPAFGGSIISMSEALKTAGLSAMQPVPQNPPTQQLAELHQNSQQAHPMGLYASYPFLPQSYAAYMPSAFQQQTIANNNAYHQSLAAAAALPQYKVSASSSNAHQSAAFASGYSGGLGSAAGAVSGSFQMNPPAADSAMSGTGLSYDDILTSQYKDNSSHLISLHQNENSSMWPNGANSRTMSGVPSSTYYDNYQGQTQQPSGFRQTRQTAPNYEALGYPNNLYHSGPGITAQAQLHNPRSGSLSGSQGRPKQSQIWQNSY